MLRTQIYLPEDLRIDLHSLATIEEISLSEIIRRNLIKSLGRDKKKLNLMEGFVGKGRARKKINGVKEITSYYQSFGK